MGSFRCLSIGLSVVACLLAGAALADDATTSAAASTAASASGGSCPVSTTGYDTSSAQAAVASANGGYINSSSSVAAGNGQQCAALVQSLSPGIGSTSSWTAGASAQTGGLQYGQPIATFLNDGHYGTAASPGGVSGSSHTAIFLNTNSDGSLQVLQQYTGQPAKIMTIPATNCKSQEMCASSYSAVAGSSPVFSQPSSGAAASTSASAASPSCSTSTSGSNAASEAAVGNIDPNSISMTFVRSVAGTCWSCNVYKAVVDQVEALTVSSYSTLFGSDGQSGSLVAFITSIFGIVLVWKVTRIVSSAVQPEALSDSAKWGDVLRYLYRVAAVSLVLFGTTAAANMSTPSSLAAGGSSSSGGAVNPVRDFMVDGPILLGTLWGCQLMTQAGAALTSASGALSTSIKITAPSSCSPSGGTWVQQHEAMADGLLGAFHQIGVGGMGIGLYMMADSLKFIVGSGYTALTDPSRFGKSVSVGICGFLLFMSFLTFTLSFGLKFIDALLRSMLVLAFLPLFIAMWVFDLTRPFFWSALRTLLLLPAAFLAAGLCAVVAVSIMDIGLAMLGVTGGSSADNIASVGPHIVGAAAQNGFSSMLTAVGVASGGSEINWGVYVLFMACFSIASGSSRMVFHLADELTKFAQGRSVTPLGLEGTMERVADFGGSVVMGLGSNGSRIGLAAGRRARRNAFEGRTGGRMGLRRRP